MVDFLAQGDALAARYQPSVVTAPAGEGPIQRVGVGTLATHGAQNRPVVLSRFPCILIVPAGGRFENSSGAADGGGGGLRVNHSDWTVRFFYRLWPDPTVHPAALQAWLSQLVNLPHVTAAQLGNTVDRVAVESWAIPPDGLLYAGTRYEGIELAVHIRSSESWTPTAA